MTSIFRFVNKQASYPFGIISLAHAPVNVTDFFIGSINCDILSRARKFTNIHHSMFKLNTLSGFHDLFRFWYV
jgi:hypothetical protein